MSPNPPNLPKPPNQPNPPNPPNPKPNPHSGCFEADNIDDVEEFNDVNNAFVQMGFSDEDVSFVFETTAALLHVGNVLFLAEGEGSVVDYDSCGPFLSSAAALLGTDESMLAQRLCNRTITVSSQSRLR